MIAIPRWDLSNVFTSLESKEFDAALVKVKTRIDDLENLFTEKMTGMDGETPARILAPMIGEAIVKFNDLYELSGTLRAYIMSFVATDSHNMLAMKKMSEFQMVGVRMQKVRTQFQAWIGKLAPSQMGEGP